MTKYEMSFNLSALDDVNYSPDVFYKFLTSKQVTILYTILCKAHPSLHFKLLSIDDVMYEGKCPCVYRYDKKTHNSEINYISRKGYVLR